MAVAGNHAYFADDAFGIRVIDITDAAKPRLVAGLDTPGEAQDVAVKGRYLYVADALTGLQVIDVLDPSAT